MNSLKFQLSELPILLEIIGKYGEKKSYILQGSKKKLGVCVHALDEKVRELLVVAHDQKNQ